MRKHTLVVLLAVLAWCLPGQALEPDEILVIANTDYAASTRLARYYCEKRGIPPGNVIPVSLGARLRDALSRTDYDNRLAGPIRRIFATLTQLEQKGLTGTAAYQQRQARVLQMQMDMDRITGKDTDASVDSELSLVLCHAYELYRWQPNALRSSAPQLFKTFMISRLDGPSYGVAKGLIDKALAAEQKGLAGVAYVDSRGIFAENAYGYYDQSLRDLAILTRLRTGLAVQEENTGALFAAGSCSQAALYCGWYSLRKYVDAFQFVDGAIGFHIASFEAASLHDPNSTEWCPALLMHGITATLGPVNEPYLFAFPEPKAFFAALFDGHCLAEAYYLTKPFNSWQMVLIGDPLYRPFKRALPAPAPAGPLPAAPASAQPALP
jgi:uncharacterized protein (TIGR03790 family)